MRLNLNIDDTIHEKVKVLADKNKRSITKQIEFMLEEQLKHCE